MATADRRDPFRSFNFQLQIDGIPLGAFSEASGLTAEGDSVDYREGTDRQNNVGSSWACEMLSTFARPHTNTSPGDSTDAVNGTPDRRSVDRLVNESRQRCCVGTHAETHG
jgi:hypothetical protein